VAYPFTHVPWADSAFGHNPSHSIRENVQTILLSALPFEMLASGLQLSISSLTELLSIFHVGLRFKLITPPLWFASGKPLIPRSILVALPNICCSPLGQSPHPLPPNLPISKTPFAVHFPHTHFFVATTGIEKVVFWHSTQLPHSSRTSAAIATPLDPESERVFPAASTASCFPSPGIH
jgi:hypothetical protein